MRARPPTIIVPNGILNGMADRTALVLSAGMMFGAWQAGVWKVLSRTLRPDVVIGVSSGALNAWAIAGGCDPQRLAESWLDPELARLTRPRFPWPPWHGVFDSEALERLAGRVFSGHQPAVEAAVVVTAMRGLRPRLIRGKEITARHLAASCAVPLVFRPVAVGGRRYIDGGLLGALPLWAAAEAGATRVVALHALPKLPSFWIRSGLRLIRAAVGRPPESRIEYVSVLAPDQPLGGMRDLVFWKRENAERWIELGERQAGVWRP